MGAPYKPGFPSLCRFAKSTELTSSKPSMSHRKVISTSLSTPEPSSSLTTIAEVGGWETDQGLTIEADRLTLLAAKSYEFFRRIHRDYHRTCDGRGLDLADEVYEFIATTLDLEVATEGDSSNPSGDGWCEVEVPY